MYSDTCPQINRPFWAALAPSSHLPLLLYLLTCPDYYAGLAAPRLGITLFNPQLTHVERLSPRSSPFLHSLHGRLAAVLWYVVVIDLLRFLTQSGEIVLEDMASCVTAHPLRHRYG